MNKIVVITGGNSGIGKAIALEFAENDYNIIINYNKHKEEAEKLKEEIIHKFGVDAITIKADISNEQEVINFVNEVKSKFTGIDVLINNAALVQDNFLNDKTTEEFRKVVDVNLTGTFLCSKLFSKIMDKGSIINISSTNGIDTYNTYSMDYDASKAGVISLTHNFAKELAPNIRVNAIAPGWIATSSVLDMNPQIIEEETKKIMLQRFGHPAEVAKLALFIAEKGTYINNSIIRIDGGTQNGN